LRPDIATNIRVRFGKPAEEILAEAATGNADLIVLPSYPPSLWSRLLAPILPRVVEQVIRKAPCRVFLASPQDRFDCEDVWGPSRNKADGGSKQVCGALEREASRVLQAEEAMASTREQHRAIA
jgi:hypothetical protein